MPLTDTRIKAAKPTDKVYKIYDADGLYIEVPPTGSKRWRFKYRINGKEKRISLGIYPEIGLKDAREKRDEARKQVAAGRDPSVIKNKTAYAEKTFQHIADEWVALHRATWAPRHTETVEQRLRSYIYPELGSVPLKDITPIEVLSVIKTIEKRGALEAARRKHPHVRGEDCRYGGNSNDNQETPPRAWGRRTVMLTAPDEKKHPHVRGEDGMTVDDAP